MILELRAKHFKDTYYTHSCNCAASKAAKEQFKAKNVGEYVDSIIVDGVAYSHRDYECSDFVCDKAEAGSHNYDNTVIRTIELTKV